MLACKQNLRGLKKSSPAQTWHSVCSGHDVTPIVDFDGFVGHFNPAVVAEERR
jgi:hypothetical protein